MHLLAHPRRTQLSTQLSTTRVDVGSDSGTYKKPGDNLKNKGLSFHILSDSDSFPPFTALSSELYFGSQFTCYPVRAQVRCSTIEIQAYQSWWQSAKQRLASTLITNHDVLLNTSVSRGCRVALRCLVGCTGGYALDAPVGAFHPGADHFAPGVSSKLLTLTWT